MGYIVFWYHNRDLQSIVNHIRKKNTSQRKVAYLLYKETLEQVEDDKNAYDQIQGALQSLFSDFSQ